ncbi:Disease resistance protein RPM1-like protein [Quillaja saponaria]|uniref:Disease resistance protein RPM1-like protein n=1 Tax=Quillaja saponaria TaxID=32244 RepID=A0AAD7KYM7_QUISA|nr:Disease resistance protein RPM1-like protein [Quillaja saponaria]
MKLLQHFGLMTINIEDEVLRLDALSLPPPYLTKLSTTVNLDKLPHWLPSLTNLKYLNLSWTRSEKDLLPHIQALPNLAELQLIRAYIGEKREKTEETKGLHHHGYDVRGEALMAILDRQVKKLHTKEVAPVKVLWCNYTYEEATWEAKAKMGENYCHLFVE